MMVMMMMVMMVIVMMMMMIMTIGDGHKTMKLALEVMSEGIIQPLQKAHQSNNLVSKVLAKCLISYRCRQMYQNYLLFFNDGF